MKKFERTLHEALLVAFGKTLAAHNAFAPEAVLNDVGREILAYLNRHGFGFAETESVSDLATLTDLFVQNGFATKLDVTDARRCTRSARCPRGRPGQPAAPHARKDTHAANRHDRMRPYGASDRDSERAVCGRGGR